MTQPIDPEILINLQASSGYSEELLKEFMADQPKDIYGALNTYVDTKARTRVAEFITHIAECATSYLAEAVDASGAESICKMSEKELLEDFNLAFNALYTKEDDK